MPTISLLLQRVHENVHVFPMKLNYSHPKIYTGGVDISQWTKLSKTEQTEALQKDWYVYYSFRDPATGKLKRQQNIKTGANRHKDKRSRFSYLKTLETSLLHLLQLGFNPYEDNTALENEYFNDDAKNKNNKNNNIVVDSVASVASVVLVAKMTSTEKALEVGLLTKSKVLNENSYKKFRSRISRFAEWLKKKQHYKTDINNINKNVIIEYLNEVLHNSSARNRNNTRSDLSSLFQTFVDNDFIEKNFIKDISVLKSTPTRNKTYTLQQQKQLYNNMEQQDPILLLFVKFVSYNFLRPIEVCRLRVGDVDLVENKLYVRAKNQPVKTKIIPEILIQDLPDLSTMNKDLYLFTPNQIGGNWDIDESNKRTYFTT